MKTKVKILAVLAIILGAILMFGFNTVNAAEYSDSEKKVIITVEDLGLGGTKSVKDNYWTEPYESDGEINPGTIYSTLDIKGVKQSLLNTYSNSAKQVNVKTKVQIPNNIIKAEIDGVVANIETINGKKYVEVSETLKYTNTPFEPFFGSGTPVNEDVLSIRIGEKDLEDPNTIFTKVKLYETETKSNEYKIDTSIDIASENVPFNATFSIVNKYGIKYQPYGGFGGYIFADKYYLQTEADTKVSYRIPVPMPQNINLKDTYFQVTIDVYQGEKIEVADLGTLYYAGIDYTTIYGKTYYLYKNSLDQLKELTETSNAILTAKTASGYTLKSPISLKYEFSSSIKEEEVTGTFNSDGNNETKLNIKYYVSGAGNAKIGAIQIPKTDYLYQKLEKEVLQKILSDKENAVIIDAFDMQVVEGAYKGKLNITFDVGTKNNGKTYLVGHLIAGTEGEYYKGTVKDGKITITVDSLSPFMVSILEEKTATKPEDKGEKDETPPTGTMSIVGYVLATTILAGVGIVAVKKNLK